MSGAPRAGVDVSQDQDFKPYIPARVSLPEMTIKVFVVGIILSWIMSSANAYLGLFAGLTVSAAIPASVVSMAVFRLFKKRNILESNLVQTTASAGESVTAGIIFSLPALILIGYWSNIGIVETMIITALGGSLGVLFTIPLRRAFIVDAKLQYPEGVATVEVLKSGETGGSGVGFIVVSALAGATFKFMEAAMGLWSEVAAWTQRFGPTAFSVAGSMSPALVAVGYIIRMPIAILIFLGGVIGYVIGVPTWLALHDWPQNCVAPFDVENLGCDPDAPRGVELSAAGAFGAVRDIYVRYIGVGGMAAGGVYTLYRLRHALVRGVKSGMDAYQAIKSSGADTRERTERDMNMRNVLIAIGLFTIPLTVLFTYFVTNRFQDLGLWWIGPILAVVMLAIGFLFSAVAGYMAGVVGSSNNPISGTGVGTLLVTALLLLALGVPSSVGPAAAILIAGTIMAAAAIAGDNMQDLKAGFLLGGTPRNLQIMQMVGAVAAAFTLPFVLMLLHSAYGIGTGAPGSLQAPQARLMQALSTGLFGGKLPWDAFWIGVGIAAVIIAIDKVLELRKAPFRLPVLAVAIGIYLPFTLSTPIFLGGVVALAAGVHAKKRARSETPDASDAVIERRVESRMNRGTLFASGLIAGEALIGIVAAGLIVYGGGTSPARLFEPTWYWEGLLLLAFLSFLIYYAVMRRERAKNAE